MWAAFLLRTTLVEIPRYHLSCITTPKAFLRRSVVKPSRRASLKKQRMKSGSRPNGERLRSLTCHFTDVRNARWKLHLRPRNVTTSYVSDQDIPSLPPNRTAIQILGDFMQYLFQCTKTYIQESHASGGDMWSSFENNIDFVLSHPNGWEGPQQAQIRRAAVLAGLVPDSPEGQTRIQLVTEGEASLHYCLNSEKTAGSFKVANMVMFGESRSKDFLRRTKASWLLMQAVEQLMSAPTT